jgi:hypothetical protein
VTTDVNGNVLGVAITDINGKYLYGENSYTPFNQWWASKGYGAAYGIVKSP